MDVSDCCRSSWTSLCRTLHLLETSAMVTPPATWALISRTCAARSTDCVTSWLMPSRNVSCLLLNCYYYSDGLNSWYIHSMVAKFKESYLKLNFSKYKFCIYSNQQTWAKWDQINKDLRGKILRHLSDSCEATKMNCQLE